MTRCARTILLALIVALAGCSAFPQARSGIEFDDGRSASDIFEHCLAAHGGDIHEYPGDINIATDGRWYSVIQRIQPVVSDAGFRVTSEERFRPRDGTYAIRHSGPAGNKYVVRTASSILVHYNGVAVDADDERTRSTAMTNDAFRMFHFGPSFIKHRATAMTRLPDAREAGRDYLRVLASLSPGFGQSDIDHVVLWIDAESSRLFRVHMTLEGFETTRGAHVDTTFWSICKSAHICCPRASPSASAGRSGSWRTSGISPAWILIAAGPTLTSPAPTSAVAQRHPQRDHRSCSSYTQSRPVAQAMPDRPATVGAEFREIPSASRHPGCAK